MQPETFEVSYKVINGKKIPVIKVRVEEKIKPDGTKDIIVHAPALSLLEELKK